MAADVTHIERLRFVDWYQQAGKDRKPKVKLKGETGGQDVETWCAGTWERGQPLPAILAAIAPYLEIQGEPDRVKGRFSWKAARATPALTITFKAITPASGGAAPANGHHAAGRPASLDELARLYGWAAAEAVRIWRTAGVERVDLAATAATLFIAARQAGLQVHP